MADDIVQSALEIDPSLDPDVIAFHARDLSLRSDAEILEMKPTSPEHKVLLTAEATQRGIRLKFFESSEAEDADAGFDQLSADEVEAKRGEVMRSLDQAMKRFPEDCRRLFSEICAEQLGGSSLYAAASLTQLQRECQLCSASTGDSPAETALLEFRRALLLREIQRRLGGGEQLPPPLPPMTQFPEEMGDSEEKQAAAPTAPSAPQDATESTSSGSGIGAGHGIVKRRGFRASVFERGGGSGVIMEGELHKAATRGILNAGRYQRRYFQLESHYLRYYKSEHSRDRLLAAIDLHSVTSIQRNGQHFTLVMLGGSPFQLRAERKSEAVAWCKVIEEAIMLDRAPPPPPPPPPSLLPSEEERQNEGGVSGDELPSEEGEHDATGGPHDIGVPPGPPPGPPPLERSEESEEEVLTAREPLSSIPARRSSITLMLHTLEEEKTEDVEDELLSEILPEKVVGTSPQPQSRPPFHPQPSSAMPSAASMNEATNSVTPPPPAPLAPPKIAFSHEPAPQRTSAATAALASSSPNDGYGLAPSPSASATAPERDGEHANTLRDGKGISTSHPQDGQRLREVLRVNEELRQSHERMRGVTAEMYDQGRRERAQLEHALEQVASVESKLKAVEELSRQSFEELDRRECEVAAEASALTALRERNADLELQLRAAQEAIRASEVERGRIEREATSGGIAAEVDTLYRTQIAELKRDALASREAAKRESEYRRLFVTTVAGWGESSLADLAERWERDAPAVKPPPPGVGASYHVRVRLVS